MRRRAAPEAAGPLLSPGVSDSASLDEAVELLVQTGWTLEAALRALMPDVPGFRRGPSGSGDPNADDGGHLLAPGMARRPSSSAMACGSAPSSDRNGLRPLAYAISVVGSSSAASEAGAFDAPQRAPSGVGVWARARCSSSSTAGRRICQARSKPDSSPARVLRGPA